jgi:hypothetical protein
VNGSEVGIPNRKFSEFAKTLTVTTVESQTNSFFQHFWNPVRSQYLGLLVGLTFGGEPSSLVGQNTVESEQAEIEVVE